MSFGEYYYKILNIPITPFYSLTQTRNEGEDEGSEEGEDEPKVQDQPRQENEPEVEDQPQQARDV